MLSERPPYVITSDGRDRATWLAARRATIGASESAIVLGVSPWGSLIELWGEKTGRAPRIEPETESEWTFWGHVLEDAICHGYGLRTGRAAIPFQLGLRSTKWDWLSATPDALATDDPEARAREPLLRASLDSIRLSLKLAAEGKVPPDVAAGELDALTLEMAAHARGWWPLQLKNIGYKAAEHWVEGVPTHYTVQCVHEAMVWGATRTTGAALVAGQRLVWDDVELASEELVQRQIVNLTRRFIDAHITPQVEPLADGSDSARGTLSQLYPMHEPEKTVNLGGELFDFAQRADRLKAEVKKHAAEIALCENRIRQAMGDAERCLLSDNTGYTLKADSKGTRRLLRKKAEP